MKSHEVLRSGLDPIGLKLAAHKLALPLSLVSRWCEPEGAADNPLERVLELMRMSRSTRILDWLCQETGGFFVPSPPSAASSPMEVLQSTQLLVAQFSQLLARVTASLANDQAISPEQASEIREIWQGLKSAGEYFVACSEAGRFRR